MVILLTLFFVLSLKDKLSKSASISDNPKDFKIRPIISNVEHPSASVPAADSSLNAVAQVYTSQIRMLLREFLR